MIKHIGLLLLILMAMLPSVSMAESAPWVCGFHGTVSAAGEALPDGTEVSAWIDGVKVAETTTDDSNYALFVNGQYTTKEVSFKVGKYEATQTATWQQGENITLDLCINAWPYQCEFYGMARVDGNKVPDGTEVSAWIDSARVQTTTTLDSLYRIVVPGNYTGKTVAFKVGSDYASQLASWERDGDIQTDLTVSIGPPVCLFYGTVQLDGEEVEDGIKVSAWIDSTKVKTSIASNSEYMITISGDYSGKTVTFTVNDQSANQSSIWIRGESNKVNLAAITKQDPLVTLDVSSEEVSPGEEFTVEITVTPNGHGISSGSIQIHSIDTSIMEIITDEAEPGDLLGTDVIEGVKEKTEAEESEMMVYALARKGDTPVPGSEGILATVGFRVKAGAKSGKYAIPCTISLTDAQFADLEFDPPTVSITVKPCTTGDIDNDCAVGLTDLAIMASAYGLKEGDDDYRPEVDLNGDKEITLADLAILASNWS